MEDELSEEPAVEAAVRHTIGAAFLGLGYYGSAERHLRRAVEIRRAVLPKRNLDLAESLHLLARAVALTGGEPEEPLKLERETYEIRRELLGDNHPLTVLHEGNLALSEQKPGDALINDAMLEVLKAFTGVGSTEEISSFLEEKLPELRRLWRNGNRDGAIQMIKETLQPFVSTHLTANITLEAVGVFASDRMTRNDDDVAEPLHNAILAIATDVFGSEHSEVADAMARLGSYLQTRGRLAEAEKLLEDALAVRRKLHPHGHPDVANTLVLLALVHHDNGACGQVERCLTEVLDVYRQMHGEETIGFSDGLTHVGFFRLQIGDYAGEEVLLRRVLELRRQLLGDEHRAVAGTHLNLAWCLHNQQKYTEAESNARAAWDISRTLGMSTIHSRLCLIWSLYNQGRSGEAAALAYDVLQEAREASPEGDWIVASLLIAYGLSLLDQGEAVRAEAPLRECLSLRLQLLAEGHWHIANAKSALGECLTAMRRFDEAEPLLVESYNCMRGNKHAPLVRVQEALERVVSLYETWDKREEADEWRRRLQANESLHMEDTPATSTPVKRKD